MGGFLGQVIDRALSVAKRVRTETDIGRERGFGELCRGGAGARDFRGASRQEGPGDRRGEDGRKRGSSSAARGRFRNPGDQSHPRTRRRDGGGSAAAACIDYEYFEDAVPEVDIVLASSGAPHFILTRDQMRAAMSKRRNRPMFLIDIAVPRNIDPAVNELESVFLYDIDDLGKVVDDNMRGRIETAKDAEEIVREEVDRMVVRLKTREAAPAIVQLQEADSRRGARARSSGSVPSSAR